MVNNKKESLEWKGGGGRIASLITVRFTVTSKRKIKTRTIDEVVLPFYSKRCTQEEEEEESQQPNSRTF
jgi:hypothetical protein